MARKSVPKEKGHTAEPSYWFGEQMKQAREARRWTQQDLSDDLKEMGIPNMDPSKIAKIENHIRDISLDEALMIAAALGVCPIHLFVPREDRDWLKLTPKVTLAPRVARKWMRGEAPLQEDDTKTYFSEVPAMEFLVSLAKRSPNHKVTRLKGGGVKYEVFGEQEEEK